MNLTGILTIHAYVGRPAPRADWEYQLLAIGTGWLALTQPARTKGNIVRACHPYPHLLLIES